MPAFVDTSCYAAIAFGEPPAATVRETLGSFDELWASPLLEAELLAALRREDVALDATDLFLGLHWALPDRPLSREIRRVLDAGHLRGGDVWHLATALAIAPDARELPFLTLDLPQRDRARALGFPTPELSS